MWLACFTPGSNSFFPVLGNLMVDATERNTQRVIVWVVCLGGVQGWMRVLSSSTLFLPFIDLRNSQQTLPQTTFKPGRPQKEEDAGWRSACSRQNVT